MKKFKDRNAPPVDNLQFDGLHVKSVTIIQDRPKKNGNEKVHIFADFQRYAVKPNGQIVLSGKVEKLRVRNYLQHPVGDETTLDTILAGVHQLIDNEFGTQIEPE